MRLTHRAWVTLLVSLIVGLGLLCAMAALWAAREIDQTVAHAVDRNLPSVVAASELQNALHEQRGLVSAYMLDGGHRAWIIELDQHRPQLAHWLKEARRTASSVDERRVLDLLEQVYAEYDRQRESVIALYQAGQTAKAKEVLLRDVAALADQSRTLCHELVAINQQSMNVAIARAHRRASRLTMAVAAGLAAAVLAATALLFLVLRTVLIPMRRLARDARAIAPLELEGNGDRFPNEMGELEFYSRALMSDVTRTRENLEESRKQLIRAEGLAAIGRFAAGAAHEIRNPLTAMKIWLYELKCFVAENPAAREKCEILGSEMGRLEALADSFLDLSRPRSLRLARQDVHAVVLRSLAITDARLREKQQHAVAVNGTRLPDVVIDSDQVHQVLINLLTNAIDATPPGGQIRVTESLETDDQGAHEVVVRVKDSGAGVPDEIRDRLFEPFITTKPGGTGLGLSIAADIVAHHGGRLVLESSTLGGSQFALHLPACTD